MNIRMGSLVFFDSQCPVLVCVLGNILGYLIYTSSGLDVALGYTTDQCPVSHATKGGSNVIGSTRSRFFVEKFVLNYLHHISEERIIMLRLLR